MGWGGGNVWGEENERDRGLLEKILKDSINLDLELHSIRDRQYGFVIEGSI